MSPKKEKPVDHLSANQSGNSPWLAWEAPEFEHYQRDWRWYLALIVVAFILVAWFYFSKNYSAIAVVVLAAILIFQHSPKSPRSIHYVLDEEGFKAGDRLYRWDQLKSFWIVVNGNTANLYLETTLRPFTIRAIHLDNIDFDQLRERLLRHLPEQATYGERMTESLIRWFKL